LFVIDATDKELLRAWQPADSRARLSAIIPGRGHSHVRSRRAFPALRAG